MTKRRTAGLLAAALLFSAASRVPGAESARRIAITFDDLPGVSVAGGTDADWAEMTGRLVSEVASRRIPAIGFVNESKLAGDGDVRPERAALLSAWTARGLELGNHTFSHPDLHRVSLREFERNVISGERVTRALLARTGKRLRFFRHPFLHTGRDVATRSSFERFLTRRGYRIAPVTIDNSDWIFARAYVNAAARGDSTSRRAISAAFVPYLERKADYYERQSRALFDREIAQVLLLHANSLNADAFGDVAAMLERRGYRFVPLSEALRDPAYRSKDDYVGSAGLSWLHRWALTRGGNAAILRGEPATPKFVLEEAGVDHE